MKKKRLSIYVKFTLVILTGSIVPIAILATVILNTMFDVYRESLKESYTQGVTYSSYSIESLLDGYNELSKYPFYYNTSSEIETVPNYKSYDNLRKILTGEAFINESDKERRTKEEMDIFFNNIFRANSDIAALHFLYENENGEQVFYHMGGESGQFASEEKFLQTIDISEIDKQSNELMIIPAHDFDYIGYHVTSKEKVFTVARNYFDLRSAEIVNKDYVGTLFIDLELDAMQKIFSDVALPDNSSIYLYDNDNLCIYSTDESSYATILSPPSLEEDKENEEEILLFDSVEEYNLNIAFRMDGLPIAEGMRSIQNIMYIFVLGSIAALLIISLLTSRRLTKPILTLKQHMAHVAGGEFEKEIEVQSSDEIGELTQHFNEMTVELKNYTNRVYVSEIKRKEAELNALKSQIYPHFLYNTLEVIRMTALSRKDDMVAQMIEALSDQIRYLIGTVDDVVPLELEIDILQKYIYLLNCRFDGRVSFSVDMEGLEQKHIPKLILQPIVENAFEHGIRPKKTHGNIAIVAKLNKDKIEITVMDDGCGMGEEELKKVETLLASDNPGHKNQYNWKSIGLKNVHDRLRHLYGESNGLSLYSSKGVGTVIKITLPANIPEGSPKNAEDDIS